MLLLTAAPAPAQADDTASSGPVVQGPLENIKDLQEAFKKCWVWPDAADIGTGMDITIIVSFRRNGEIFGGRVSYQTPNVSDEERSVYAAALVATIKRCSPLPLSDGLGGAIAGRLFSFHFIDNRKRRKA